MENIRKFVYNTNMRSTADIPELYAIGRLIKKVYDNKGHWQN